MLPQVIVPPAIFKSRLKVELVEYFRDTGLSCSGILLGMNRHCDKGFGLGFDILVLGDDFPLTPRLLQVFFERGSDVPRTPATPTHVMKFCQS